MDMRISRTRRHRCSTAVLGIALAGISIGASSTGAGTEIVSFRKVDDGANTLSDLRARELSLPRLGSEDICPVPAYPEPVVDGAGNGVRAGPVAAVGIGVNGVLPFHADSASDSKWLAGKILWLLDADLPPLLVRGRRLDGPGSVRFRNGESSVSGLVLDEDVMSTVGPEWRDQPSGPQVKEPGCYALQVDGSDFQSVIVFRAIAGDVETPSRRMFELRDLRLDAGEAVAFGFHPTRDPVTIGVTADGLEVCPAELADVFDGVQTVGPYWFDVCLPLEKGVALDLPTPPVAHIALLVRARTDASVRVARLSVTYEAGDEFFHLAPLPLDPGERSAALIITRSKWDVVVAGPPESEASGTGVWVVVTQRGERVRVVNVENVGRDGAGHGPIVLGEPVVVRMQNKAGLRQPVSLAVYWV